MGNPRPNLVGSQITLFVPFLRFAFLEQALLFGEGIFFMVGQPCPAPRLLVCMHSGCNYAFLMPPSADFCSYEGQSSYVIAYVKLREVKSFIFGDVAALKHVFASRRLSFSGHLQRCIQYEGLSCGAHLLGSISHMSFLW